MGQPSRRAAGTRSKRTQLGLVAITVATALIMAWAIMPAAAAGEQVCPPTHIHGPGAYPALHVTVTDVGDNPDTWQITADPDFLITSVCVKAGSANQGNGPEISPVNPPQQVVTVNHSSGKDISHISVVTTAVTTTTTPPPTTTTPPPTTTTPPPQKGRIVLKKETIPDGDPTQFTFTGAFNIAIGDGQGSVRIVSPGTYSVSEAVPAGWTLTSIVCDDDDSSGSGTTATYIVDPGETVKCVFTNTKNPPTTTTPPPTTTTPPPTTTTTTPPPTTTTTEPPTVGPTTIEPTDSTTTQPPGGTAFTGVQNVVPLGAIALLLLTTGSGLMWAGSRRKRGENDQE